MKEYKDYNNHCIQWMGNIPSHWNSLGLKRTINLINEKTTDESLTYIGLENIESFTGRLSNTKFVTADSTCNLFKIGDILFNKLRPYLTKSIIADFEGKCTTELLVLRGFKGDTKYLNYILLSPEYIGYIDSSTYGSKMPRANWNFIGNVNIPYPPLVEQQHIVSFLDEKTAKIDEYIDKKNKEIEALKEWKKALIAHVVTKGLNTNAKMKKFKSLLSDEIPSHWKIVRNKNIFESHYEAVSSRKNIPLLSLTTEGVILRDISTGKGKFPKDFEMYNVVYPNNIIFCLFDLDETPRTVGLCYNYGMITNAYTIFKIKNTVLPEYITNYYLAVDNIKALRPYYSGLRKVVQSNRFNSIQIPLPPIEEQQEIVEYIEAATTKADKMIVELTNHVESMKEYKQRLIADVVTGKINVQP